LGLNFNAHTKKNSGIKFVKSEMSFEDWADIELELKSDSEKSISKRQALVKTLLTLESILEALKLVEA